MGTIFSSPDDPNPATPTTATTTAAATATATATTTTTMSETPSENPKNPDQENTPQPPKTLETLNPNQESQNPNQESSKPTSAMSETPSENPKIPDQENTPQPPKTPETPKTLNPNQESQNPNQEPSSKPVQDNDNPDAKLEKEEEGECPFCAYMKGGECRETFINWEKCIESNGDEDIVEKCFEATSALAKCMEANPDYYAPILQAEKRAEQKVLNKLEQEKAKEAENAKEAEKANEVNEEKVKQETS